AINPRTGDLWAVEHAPQGGDELNIILPGRNYGWPLVSYARDYAGSRITQIPWQAGLEQPTVFWVPSIGPSGLTFYTGDKFPRWQGDVFVGSLRTGTLRGTGHLERIDLNEQDQEIARELEIDLNAYYAILQDASGSRLFSYDDIMEGDDSAIELAAGELPGPCDGLQRDTFKAHLSHAIDGLPDREKLVLALYYDEELNLKEIGEVIGVSESRVSQIHSQAAMRLKARLSDWN
ncbi:MAG: sigma-70 family RNA polymerase sigma factor, partial [Gammaproteobacteria bacterium]|nr:sigma-70 family RNA polymerase sigma factor [Gammaproteobacteria bacterium]